MCLTVTYETVLYPDTRPYRSRSTRSTVRLGFPSSWKTFQLLSLQKVKSCIEVNNYSSTDYTITRFYLNLWILFFIAIWIKYTFIWGVGVGGLSHQHFWMVISSATVGAIHFKCQRFHTTASCEGNHALTSGVLFIRSHFPACLLLFKRLTSVHRQHPKQRADQRTVSLIKGPTVANKFPHKEGTLAASHSNGTVWVTGR